MRVCIVVASILAFLSTPDSVGGDDLGIDLSDGLRIQQVADDDLVPDCTNITVSPAGQVFASGPGYIRRLIDENQDDRFDRFETIHEGPSHGAHGLCCDSGDLYFVGDDGVWRLSDGNGESLAEASPRRVLKIKTGGEHDAHALRKGPDGDWYLIAGNKTDGSFELQNAIETSVPTPRAGAIWRISPDWSQREVWAHGFRNAFDFDFAPGNAIDTFDSDGERDVSLPWYRPTRVFRVHRGADAGWLTRSWKRPNQDPQMPTVLAQLGRGSPTGVLRYRQHRLPRRFRQGLFVLDWTFGRIVFVGDDHRVEVVAQPSGNAGFAVTDIDALPDGRILVSVGGRKSRGGIYLIDVGEPNASAGPDQDSARSESSFVGAAPTAPARNTAAEQIRLIRQRPREVVDQAAAAMAIGMLPSTGASSQQRIDAMILLVESLGGLGAGDPKDARGEEQVAAVFDGYRSRLRPKIARELIDQATDSLVSIVLSASPSDPLVEEAIRTLAVLEPDSREAYDAIARNIARVESPTAKLHRLIALARLPVARDDEMTDAVAEVMLEIPRLIEQRQMKLDRNWEPRMAELFAALAQRDSLLPSRLVSDPRFGDPTDLVWTGRLDPENLERARRLFLQRSAQQPIDPAVARFIARGDDAIARRHLSRWIEDPTTRPAAWLAIAGHPSRSDIGQLQIAARSVDQEVREAARRALQRLGAEIPERSDVSPKIDVWLAKATEIAELAGDTQRGGRLFVSQQCATCHDGGKALGPPLEGVSKRFSPADLLRATVDPNHTVPDRYRARTVLTDDGRVLVGMPIYESVDGLTLLTVEAKTIRINSEQIAEVRPTERSLMPEGLVDELSDSQVADLLAFLKSL